MNELGTSMTWRELQTLVFQLPPASRLAVEIFGTAHSWSRLEYMVADLIDAVQGMRYEAKALRSKKAGSPPKPYPRPARDRAKELAPRLAEWQARHGKGERRGR